MLDYRMPLFDRYDMSVEFDMHIADSRKVIRSDRHRFSSLPDDDLIEFFCCEIACLELFPDEARMSVHEDSGNGWIELAVPFRGDASLWNLYPVEPISGLLGEVFRGHLLLQALGDNSEVAEAIFKVELEEISQVIEQQCQRVETFASAVPSIILSEARRIRYSEAPGIRTFH